jgi:tetratricopeptide (TPR) repeat protein
MRWLTVALLLAVSLGPPSARAAQQASPLPELPKLDVEKFPPETREQVQQAYTAAQSNPKDAGAVGKLGMLLDLYDRKEDAAICYQRAQQLDPRSFQWLYYWGTILVAKKKKDQAVHVLTSAVRLRPDYLPAKLKLAEAIHESGDVEDTRKIYGAILRDHPDSAEALYGLGRVYAARGDLAAATKLYTKACELLPTYGAAHYALAMIYRKLGQGDKAQEHLGVYERNKNVVPPVDDPLRDELRALDMSAVAHLERGVDLEHVGRIEDAVAETERAVQLDPKLVAAHANLIILYGQVGNVEKAEEHYQAVLALNPDQFDQFFNAHYAYGVLLMRQRRYEEAEKAFRRAIHGSPFNAFVHNNLGYVLEREGRVSEAVAEYRKSIESDPNFRQAHFNLGRILVNQENYQEGIEQLAKTLTPVDENTPVYLYALGAAYGRAGDRTNALRYLHEAQQQASARGQSQLLSDIEADLRTLEGSQDSR